MKVATVSGDVVVMVRRTWRDGGKERELEVLVLRIDQFWARNRF